jgi:hypothetical protein
MAERREYTIKERSEPFRSAYTIAERDGGVGPPHR